MSNIHKYVLGLVLGTTRSSFDEGGSYSVKLLPVVWR